MRVLPRVLLFLAALAVAGSARAADQPLRLDDATSTADAWPWVRALDDPGARITFDEARRRTAEFTTPSVPTANFGPRTGALWLHVPIVLAGHQALWVLEIDYPPLNHIDAYLVRDGHLLRHVPMGNALPAADRPMRSRSHTVMLDLQRGPYDLFLRVQSSSAVVVPIRVHRADAFVNAESARLLLQGLLFGISLVLLASSLINGFSLRDRVFGYYALMIVGVSTFFVSFSGLGHQFLWASQTGPLAKVSPWGALLATVGVSLFAVDALDLRRSRPRTARWLRAAAVAAALAIVASVAGALDYRRTQLAATILGPIPIVLVLFESVHRARRGQRLGVYLTVGWSAYAVGALSMAAVLRGWIPVNFWVQHLFQFASVVEMFAWMRVLSLRIEAVRRDAERSVAERQALRSLAHTDPLTGLPNRRGLAEALEAALPAARADLALAVYLLDLDGFKAVNDRLGHDAGDELLVQVSGRLRAAVRASDLVARLGGDEFVVMSGGITSEAAALRLGDAMLAALDEPFVVSGDVCRVGATIGVALAPKDGLDAGDLLRRADAAMYAGKQGGGRCVRSVSVTPPGLAEAS